MRTTVLLADSAQVDPAGKVHALGLGWRQTVSPTPPAALVILIDVEWTETNQPFVIEAELVDEDGQNVLVPGPTGNAAVSIHADIELGRPPGSVAGTPFSAPLTANIGAGMPLLPGRTYRWRVTNSAQPGEELGVSFFVQRDY